MSIEIGQITFQCDGCAASLVHNPSFLPVSSRIPAWSAQEAIQFACKYGWVIQYDQDISDFWVDCPLCASKTDQGT